MKKTLLALAVAAVATSASAQTVFENDGTKVDFWGSLRVSIGKESSETKKADGTKTKDSGNTTLHNNGTRFGVKVNHALNDQGFYALGNMQVRLKNDGSSGFGDLYAKHVFVGLGKKELGQVTFGKQLTIADDVGLANDYEFGILSDYVPTSSTGAIRYDYLAIDGLTLSANYNFAQNNKDDGTALAAGKQIKNGFAFGGTYEVEGWVFQGVYGRTNYKVYDADKHRADAFDAAIGYNISDALLVGIDGGYKAEKTGGNKDHSFYIGPMAKFQVTDASSIYGNYMYERVKDEETDATSPNLKTHTKTKTHGFLAGVDYKFHKHALAYVEGKYVKSKDYNADGSRGDRVTDKAIAIGMRVNW